ncbi:hypothetical protein WDW89_21100 [Deltaproteobacteria bacterium TL4]
MTKEEKLVNTYLEEGKKLMDSKLYDRAMVEFNKALEVDRTVAHKELGTIYQDCMIQGNFEGVISVGSNILIDYPEEIDLANLVGNAYRKINNLDQARKLYEHSLQIDPKAKLPSYNLAATLAHVDLYDNDVVRAISEFEGMRFFVLPDNEAGENELLEIEKDIQEELTQKKQEEPEPEKPTADAKKGKKEDQEEAVINPQHIYPYIRNKVGLHTPRGEQLLVALGVYCLKNKASHISQKIFSSLLTSNTQNELLKMLFILSKVSPKEVKTAINELKSLLSNNPYNRYVCVNLGILYQMAKNPILSRKYFLLAKQLLDRSQGYYDMATLRNLGEKFFIEENYKKALPIYEVFRIEQESLGLLDRIVQSQLHLENFDEALATLRRIQELEPENTKAKETLAEIHKQCLTQAKYMKVDRKYSKAIEFLERSLKIERSNEVLEQLVDLYLKSGDKKKVEELKEEMQALAEEKKQKELEKEYLEKCQEGELLEAKKDNYKAITAFESALRLKPDKEIMLKLVNLFKKTRQTSMIGDLTKRYNNMIDYQQRMEQYKKDAERRKKAETEDAPKGT